MKQSHQHRKKNWILLVLMSTLFFIVGSFMLYQIQSAGLVAPKLAGQIPYKQVQHGTPYQLSTLYLTVDESIEDMSAWYQFQQTMVPNHKLDHKTLEAFGKTELEQSYDLIYLDLSGIATYSNTKEATAWLEKLGEKLEAGATLFVHGEDAAFLPQEWTGVSLVKEERDTIDFTRLKLHIPEASFNLEGLQRLLTDFIEDYMQHEFLETLYANEELLLFGEPQTAEPLVNLKLGMPRDAQHVYSLLTVNRLGEGQVIWSNGLVPNQLFSTSYDLHVEGGQPFFHFGLTTANALFHQELLHFISKEKYGFAIEKAFGPYGRAGLAWQNHYEALNSFDYKELIEWSELLKENHQIATFSIVRGAYNWGRWQSSLSIHENLAEADNVDEETGQATYTPQFQGIFPNSFYSAGERLEAEDSYFIFGDYPVYVSLMGETKQNYRAYPVAVDWTGNGLFDLIVGGAEGKVYLLQNSGTLEQPQFLKQELLLDIKATTLAEAKRETLFHASPMVVDFNQNGQLDLILPSANGELVWFKNEGTVASPSFAYQRTFKLPVQNGQNVSGVASPRLVDWNGNGTLDLLLGTEQGEVYLFQGRRVREGAEQILQFGSGRRLQSNLGVIETTKHAAPFAVDWNSNGQLDLLVGNGDGTIDLYLAQPNGVFDYQGELEATYRNFFGNPSLLVGRNAVPLVLDWNHNGKLDLLTGQLEYGIPVPVDSAKFPYRDALDDIISYAQANHIPLIPHMYLYSFVDAELEAEEMALHKQAFANLGIPWEEDMGVNHHTWRISWVDPARTFRQQREHGIWWNFGFNPPGVSTAPRDGKEFLWTYPFLLPDEQEEQGQGFKSKRPENPFILFAPAPHALKYGDVWNQLSYYNIPLTYFEHIEYNVHRKNTAYQELLQKIDSMNHFRATHEYNFMTEEQMARALLNAFYTELDIQINGHEIHIKPNVEHVPELAKEYTGTLGVRIIPGEVWREQHLLSSSPFIYLHEGVQYVGLPEATLLSWHTTEALHQKQTALQEEQELRPGDPRLNIQVIRSNTPVKHEMIGQSLQLTLQSTGMQQIKLFSHVRLDIKSDYDILVEQDGLFYTITHFGDIPTITISLVEEEV